MEYVNEDVINVDCDNGFLQYIIDTYTKKFSEQSEQKKTIKGTFKIIKNKFESRPMTKKEKLAAGIMTLNRIIIFWKNSKLDFKFNIEIYSDYTIKEIKTTAGTLIIAYAKNRGYYKTYKEKDYIQILTDTMRLNKTYLLYEYNDVDCIF